jgi:hypothetical protein
MTFMYNMFDSLIDLHLEKDSILFDQLLSLTSGESFDDLYGFVVTGEVGPLRGIDRCVFASMKSEFAANARINHRTYNENNKVFRRMIEKNRRRTDASRSKKKPHRKGAESV